MISRCVKTVLIWSFPGPCFIVFGMNTKICPVYLRNRFECGKIQTRKTPSTDTFYAALSLTVLKDAENAGKRYFPVKTYIKTFERTTYPSTLTSFSPDTFLFSSEFRKKLVCQCFFRVYQTCPFIMLFFMGSF